VHRDAIQLGAQDFTKRLARQCAWLRYQLHVHNVALVLQPSTRTLHSFSQMQHNSNNYVAGVEPQGCCPLCSRILPCCRALGESLTGSETTRLAALKNLRCCGATRRCMLEQHMHTLETEAREHTNKTRMHDTTDATQERKGTANEQTLKRTCCAAHIAAACVPLHAWDGPAVCALKWRKWAGQCFGELAYCSAKKDAHKKTACCCCVDWYHAVGIYPSLTKTCIAQ
jgi:hypothetical protein